MGQNLARIATGFVLAFATASVALYLARSIVVPSAADDWHGVLPMFVRIAGVTMPILFPLLLLGEARRIRGLPYWMGCGLFAGALAAAWLAANGWISDFGSTLSAPAILTLTGAVGGMVYWIASARGAGGLAAAMERLAGQPISDKRCVICTLTTLLVAAIPLVATCWAATMMAKPEVLTGIRRQAEADAREKLLDAGLPGLSLEIDGSTGKVTGKLEPGKERSHAFEAAEQALAPLVGVGGVVDRLESKIVAGEDGNTR